MLCARTARLPWFCRRADPHRSAVAEMKLLLLWVTFEIGGNRGPLLRLERQRSGGSGCKVYGSRKLRWQQWDSGAVVGARQG